jgi:endonuclease/exonuclease/phosphatase family metal-dependent hydrolase
MTDWILSPQSTPVAALTEVPLDRRNSLRDGPGDHATYRAAHDTIPALREVERGGPAPQADGATGWLRVVGWNVERLRHLTALAARIEAQAPDVCLLTEIDKGMTRTGNGHLLADLSARLVQGYAYGLEFVELDRGSPAERATVPDTPNALGFHGNAVLSRLALHRPAILRLEAEGTWFDGTRGEPRVGGRMAVAAQVMLDARPVTVVAVHLESHSDPAHRAGQATRLMDLIDQYDPAAPVVIAGDFNTSTWDWPRTMRDGDGTDPLRRLRPQPHEPLFDAFTARGYDWRGANVPDVPTQRLWAPDPGRTLGKIDWVFTRGLHARNPAVLPATYPDGATASDHEGLYVEVAHAVP